MDLQKGTAMAAGCMRNQPSTSMLASAHSCIAGCQDKKVAHSLSTASCAKKQNTVLNMVTRDGDKTCGSCMAFRGLEIGAGPVGCAGPISCISDNAHRIVWQRPYTCLTQHMEASWERESRCNLGRVPLWQVFTPHFLVLHSYALHPAPHPWP